MEINTTTGVISNDEPGGVKENVENEGDSVSSQSTSSDCNTNREVLINAAADCYIDPNLKRNAKVSIFGEDKGPKLYPVKGNVVTPPIISKNLPVAFQFMPIYSKSASKDTIDEIQNNRVREYVGFDLSDNEYEKLEHFCSPEHLKIGNEIVMSTRYPIQGLLPCKEVDPEPRAGDNLCILKKLKLRLTKDVRNRYPNRMKYRAVRLLPLPNESNDYKISLSPLEPGKDLLFHVRVYRPFTYSGRDQNDKRYSRHSLFSSDMIMLGRQKLTVLRDRIVCANDVGMRVDVSDQPDELPTSSARDLFPSNFLFINNKFYVDTRPGCRDLSEPLRLWASTRGLGVFDHTHMDVRLDELEVKLGHPEVYVHQGNCEHLFTFSEIRLLNPTDPQKLVYYPYSTAVSQNQTIYCTTCAEFGAKWIVTGCEKVPFDPAFFCDTCLKIYLYKDGKKICDFKAYAYRGNDLNLLKPPAAV
ncbi:snRNA-activating protein complex subunit 3 [Danaus plexippus]|uniref:snRNA-activating protein complex subunit 3 n=1 Tax=Danaus plexippus TaxID=13037 RepID=UPI002AB25CBB|nr:snRNA-activating protein complex subunit 3 [Danaus plexippus]